MSIDDRNIDVSEWRLRAVTVAVKAILRCYHRYYEGVIRCRCHQHAECLRYYEQHAIVWLRRDAR